MEFINTITQLKKNWQPYKQWDIEQQKKEKQNKELYKKYPPTNQELEHAGQFGRTIVDVINTMDQHSIDKSEDSMVVVGNLMSILSLFTMSAGVLLGNLLKHIPKIKNSNKLSKSMEIIGLTFAAGVSSVFESIFSAHIQKQASRIARFQTRENDLKDYKDFIVYDKEQLSQAQKIAQNLPDVKEKKTLSIKQSANPIKTFINAKKTTDDLSKDYKSYNSWKEKHLRERKEKVENFDKINPTNEEITKAEQNRDSILNTIKKIENSSLNYFMNMSLALTFIKTAVFASGVALSGGIIALLGKLQTSKILPPKSAPLNSLKLMLPIVTPVTLMLTLLGPVIKLQKDAARIGRFKAKQDLLKNNENFLTYTDEQKKTVKQEDIKQTKSKSFLERFKEDISALKHFKNDYQEYKNYMETTHKEELKLNEALKQIKISDKQKEEAKVLQKNSFLAFEEMDEKAQRFTDDTDAAVDSGRAIIATVLSTTCKIISFCILGEKLAKHSNKDFAKLSYKEIWKLLPNLTGKEIAIVMGTFIAPAFINIPITIKGIQLKKDAGKIGVMTAMQDLDNPKNFL